MANPISFPTTTSTYGLPLLFAGQAQKEFFLNQSATLIDIMLKGVVEDSVSAPPSDPTDNSCYRVTATASGEWEGHEDAIAVRIGGAWEMIEPFRGMRFYDAMRGTLLHFDSQWRMAGEALFPTGGTIIDTEARLAISKIIEALRETGILPPVG